MVQKNYLFVCGCPRSGTTALTRLLNAHPSIAIGVERYKNYAKKQNISKLNKDFFESDNFFDIKPGHTNINPKHKSWESEWKDVYDSLKPKFKSDKLIVGDKFPHYYLFYHELSKTFDRVKWIFILRDVKDVALSYNSRANNRLDKWSSERDYTYAVKDWNEAIEKTWDYLESGHHSLFICEYDKLFCFNPKYFKTVLSFLEVDCNDDMEQFYENLTSGWDDRLMNRINLDANQAAYIDQTANWKLRDALLEKYGVYCSKAVF